MHRARALLLPLILALASCAAPAADPAKTVGVEADAAPQAIPAQADQAAPRTSAPAPAAPTPSVPPAARKPAPPMSDPLPPEVLPAPVALDRSCRADADCAVKDVGNCCGYYPACVNKGSPTDPEGVRARCAEQGMASACGFAEIRSCQCVQGQCEAGASGAVAR